MRQSKPSIKLLDKGNTDYIKYQLETGSVNQIKSGLQQLCKLYRRGFRIRPEQLIGIEQSIVGLLYTRGKDEKVRRWALNAIARLGRAEFCLAAVESILETYPNEPQTIAAAVAAIGRMKPSSLEVMKGDRLDSQLVTLAALQHVPANTVDLSPLPLDIETASPEMLKLALVLVGLDKAPDNILNPRHNNAQMVKALGSHHDSVVSQYTIWATTENPSLGISDIGVELKDIERQPANVRAWLFELISLTSEDAEAHWEYIELGMRDPDVEARIGLARGLKDSFFDGLDALVLDWFTSESEIDVRQSLADHLVRQSHNSSNYAEIAEDVYRKEAPGSEFRQRMEASAAGTPMFAKFKRIGLTETNDLFGGGYSVTNINISGGVQGGAVSVGGGANNSGSVSIHYNPQTIEAIRAELSRLERALHASEIDTGTKNEALEEIKRAQADPAPGTMTRALDVLRRVEAATGAVAGASGSISGILEHLKGLAGLS